MKVFSKLSHIKDLIDAKKIGFIKCFSDDKTIIANTSDMNYSPEQNFTYLEELLDSLEGEYIKVVLYKNEKDNYPMVHHVKLTTDGEKSAGTKSELQPNNFAIGLLNQMTELRLQMQATDHKYALEKLQEQMENLKKGKDKKENPMYEKLFNLGTEFLMKDKLAKAAQIAVTTPTPIPTPTPNKVGIFGTGEKEKFSELVRRWKTSDSNFLETMEKIVQLSESNPDTYNMYRNMLVQS